jgi:hypothetical protein
MIFSAVNLINLNTNKSSELQDGKFYWIYVDTKRQYQSKSK